MEIYQYILIVLVIIISGIVGYILSRICKEEVKSYKDKIKILKIIIFLFIVASFITYLVNKDIELFIGSLVLLSFIINTK